MVSSCQQPRTVFAPTRTVYSSDVDQYVIDGKDGESRLVLGGAILRTRHSLQRKRSEVTCTIFLALISYVFLFIHTQSVAGQQGQITLVSVNSTGNGSGNALSGDFNSFRITPDGRYVLFYSEATDIVPLGATRAGDLFVRDLQTGKTKMVSINMSGTPSTGRTSFGLISDNGRFVVFTGFPNNIVNNDTNSSEDVFIRDMESGTTKLVSLNAAGTASGALGGSDVLDITPDARFIVFSSHAVDLTSEPDGNGLGGDIYVRDVVNNATRLVSVNRAGTASGNGSSFDGKISADGRYVVFTSEASDLVASDTNTRDVFIRDLKTNTTKRVSTNAAGNGGGNGESFRGVVDKGGRFVVFATRATDLSPLPDNNQLAEVFIYDIQTDSNRLITVNATGTETGAGIVFPGNDHGVEYSISADGRFVAFMSQQTTLVTNDTNRTGDDIFLYNIATQTKSLVSVNLAGTSGTSGGSFRPTISDDGRYVAFESLANDLVTTADEPLGFSTDVFLRDVVKGETSLISINSAHTRTGNRQSFQPLITSDGKRLVFFSLADDLITNDLNGFNEDVFVFSLSNPGAPLLLKEENSERAIAFDSVTHLADPFPLLTPFNFNADQRTRVSLFVWGLDLLPGEDKSAVSVNAEDPQHTVFPLTVEYVGEQAGLPGTKQVVVKLPEGVVVPADLWVTVTLRGLTSNRAVVKIKP